MIFSSILLLTTVLGDFTPNHYVIDMSKPANERWAQACTEMKYDAIAVYDTIVKYIPPDIMTEIENIGMDYWENSVWEPYRSEIQYFAECTGLKIGDFMAINLLYDLTAFCTSIVAENEDGVIIHGRNLDYGFPALRDDTFTATFIDENGNVMFDGTSFFGYAGMWTGRSVNGFTLSGDERDQGEWVENMRAIINDERPSSWLMRDVLANATSFDEALDWLTNIQIQAPVYYILGGEKYPDAAVVTRNQTGAVDVWKITDSDSYGWYLVETNYDHWTPAPTHDDRRDDAINAMNKVGQANLTYNTMYQVMSTPNVLNDHTLYTTIMSASDLGYYQTTVRVPTDEN